MVVGVQELMGGLASEMLSRGCQEAFSQFLGRAGHHRSLRRHPWPPVSSETAVTSNFVQRGKIKEVSHPGDWSRAEASKWMLLVNAAQADMGQ